MADIEKMQRTVIIDSYGSCRTGNTEEKWGVSAAAAPVAVAAVAGGMRCRCRRKV